VLGVPLDAVDLKDATGRRLHKNGATFEQYGAQLPIEGSEARGLRGGMPAKQGALGKLVCVVSVLVVGLDSKVANANAGANKKDEQPPGTLPCYACCACCACACAVSISVVSAFVSVPVPANTSSLSSFLRSLFLFILPVFTSFTRSVRFEPLLCY
jgi:hypothetical protein